MVTLLCTSKESNSPSEGEIKLSKPDENIVLPEVISKEPLGPAVRVGDEQWFNIARWTLFALVNAEELEVRSATTADDKVKSKKANVRRLLGAEGTFGVDLGLDADLEAGDRGAAQRRWE